MKDNYDFSQSIQNPYAKRLKQQITIELDEDTIGYFKNIAEEKGIPYQSIINLYLKDCAEIHRKLEISWI
jgi:predicted DNA binding CopG/RHH family protein